ncbi:MAG: hypothetical protein IID46_15135, partial [Planctomycetes bacterium]|nr:hypothetical protein [Planctomycetota bacterium]
DAAGADDAAGGADDAAGGADDAAGGADDAAGGDDAGTGDDGTGGGEGGGGTPKFKEGTAEHAVLQTWTAIKNGEQTGLAAFISLRAKGELAALRDGKLSAERLDELKKQLALVKLLKPRSSGSSKTISLQNEEGGIFRFTCRKEKGKYVIRSFVIKEPSKSKRRKGY